jgi:hypothetical protein
MPNHIEQQIMRSTRPAFNDVNDPYPAQSTPTASGSLTQYAEQLGGRVWLDGSALGVKYDSTIGTLYGGEFQYVQFFNGTTAPAVGLPTAWAWDQANGAFESYIVTCDMNSALRTGRFAGFCLNAVTKGNYGWIQVSGKCTGLTGTLTAATPADGDMLIIASATGLVDDPTQSGNPTYATLKAAIGTAIGAPTSAALCLILVRKINEVV